MNIVTNNNNDCFMTQCNNILHGKFLHAHDLNLIIRHAQDLMHCI